MNLTLFDWSIVAVFLAFMFISVIASRTLMRSVTDFLAAGRSAGRYLICVAKGIAWFGAISVIRDLEMNYLAGFSMAWWELSMSLVMLIVYASGWVIYRFRQTRALTLPQFFEMRYSRRFRIFSGILAFFSGLINFGIFPAVGARFFIYFCGLPQSFQLFGLGIATFPLVMAVLLAISLYFVFAGGQIAVIITDFFQGIFVDLVFIALIVFVFVNFDWSAIQEALSSAPENASLINPFRTGEVEAFNFWFFLIGVIGFIYNTMSWQGTQAYNSSARSAHEAKMGFVLFGWKRTPMFLMFVFIPVVAYTVLHHPSYSALASGVASRLEGLDSEVIRTQLKVPLVLSMILPRGLIGAFVAVMLAAFVTTHDTYLHSWASIFVQDVIMPFRKRPFTPERHLLVLRLSIVGVALFIFLFSLLFKQSEYIALFLAVTGTIFVGGSGAVLIGGLYWKRGTTAAAWTAMITGCTIAVSGILIHQLVDDFFINGQVFWLLGMAGASASYVLVSLLGKKEVHDMDRLLKRGKYEIRSEHIVVDEKQSRVWRMLMIGKEFTRGDKVIYLANYLWTFTWTAVFITGVIYNLTHDVSDLSWMRFWKIYLLAHLALAVVTVVWFTIGGAVDLKKMIGALRTMKRDHTDDGFISRQEDGDKG